MIDPYRALGIAAKATTAVALGWCVGAVTMIAWATREVRKGWAAGQHRRGD